MFDNEIMGLHKISNNMIAIGIDEGDYKLALINWITGKTIKTFFKHTYLVMTILKLKNKKNPNLLLSAGEDRKIFIWNYMNG